MFGHWSTPTFAGIELSMGRELNDLHRLETDEELRVRLFYVTGDRFLYSLQAAQLDEYALRYSLNRRRISP